MAGKGGNGQFLAVCGEKICFPALVPLLLSVGAEDGEKERRMGWKALIKGAAGICVARAILGLSVGLGSLCQRMGRMLSKKRPICRRSSLLLNP